MGRGAFIIGCIYIVRQGRGKIEYRKPVNIEDDVSQGLFFHIVPYTYDQSQNVYSFNPGNVSVIRGKDIIMSVKLSERDDRSYELSKSDSDNLDEFLKPAPKPIQKPARKRKTTAPVSDNEEPSNAPSQTLTGMVRLVVEPEENTTGNRRSKRIKFSLIGNQ